MTTPSYNTLFAWPFYQNVSALYTPTIDGGLYLESLPLTNLQDRRPKRVARSVDALNTNTRMRFDLKTDRPVRAVVLPSAYRGPDAPISSAGYVRVLGVPSTMLFDYEAGDDIVARGGTFTRVPTTDVRVATYIDRNGVLKYAGENLALQSAAFGTTWSASNVTVASNTVANPQDLTITADTLTASAGNGTVIQDLGVLASAAFVFSVWLKRKTGSGNIQMTLDNGSTWTTKTLTTKWQRFYITQTLANPDCGIRIVTNGDAVYSWGAQAEHGTTPTGYVPTTSATNGAPRDGHFIGGYRHLLMESARTNSCLRSQEFDNASWIKDEATITANAAIAPDGTLTADKLVESANNAIHQVYQTIAGVTSATTQSHSVFAKAAERTWIVVRGTGASRSFINLSTGAIGTKDAAHTIVVESLGNGWYRIDVSFLSSGTSETIAIYTATADGVYSYTGSTSAGIYIWGAQYEIDQPTSSAYIPTTSAAVTRAADALSFPITFTPQALTAYVKMNERGNIAGLTSGRPMVIATGGDPTVYFDENGAGKYRIVDTSVTSVAAAAPAIGDTVELRGLLYADGSVQLGQSINSGTEAVATQSGADTLAAAFSPLTLLVNSTGVGAYQAIRVATGAKTMAEMQAIVYDSGWQNQYPTGATAETLDGMNVPHALIIADTQTAARYWSVQIDDESNSNGYVDVGMVVIAGAYQPTINMAQGAAIGFSTDSTKSKTPGGAMIPTERPVTRNPRFTVSMIPESEGMTSAADMMRRIGTTGQVYWFWDPTDTSANYLHRRSLLATLKELSPIQFPFASYNEVAFELEEEL